MNAFAKLDADRIMKRLEQLAGRKLGTDVRIQVQRELARGVRYEAVESRQRKLIREDIGVIQRKRSRKFGVWVCVLEAEAADLDPSGGKYVTICEEHGTVCNHKNLEDAKRHAPLLEWCEQCQDPHGE